jgi:hypothetical protein
MDSCAQQKQKMVYCPRHNRARITAAAAKPSKRGDYAQPKP